MVFLGYLVFDHDFFFALGLFAELLTDRLDTLSLVHVHIVLGLLYVLSTHLFFLVVRVVLIHLSLLLPIKLLLLLPQLPLSRLLPLNTFGRLNVSASSALPSSWPFLGSSAAPSCAPVPAYAHDSAASYYSAKSH